MDKPKIYVNKPISQEVKIYLESYFECIRNETSLNDIGKEKLKDIKGILTAGTTIDKDLLDSFPNLEIVSNMSVGYNNFDIKEMKKRNIIGTHTPYVLEETVADLAFGLMISAARRIPELNNFVKKGNWKPHKNFSFMGTDVNNTTLGIIGMGRIGEVIAKRAIDGFNMNVLYHNRTQNKEVEKNTGAKYSSKDYLLKNSDFVILLIPLNNETIHYLNYKHFKIMKESSIFINISRGKTVNEYDLIQALQEKQIKAAGLDVFDEEPTYFDNPLLKMDNVVCVPHIGTATYRTRENIAMLAAKNLVNFIYKKNTSPFIVKELRSY